MFYRLQKAFDKVKHKELFEDLINLEFLDLCDIK